MKIFSKCRVEDPGKEERRKRMEAYLRRLWGEQEIDFKELIYFRADAREKALSKLGPEEKVGRKPKGSRDFFVMIDLDRDLDFITDWPLKSEQSSVLAEINSVENQPWRHLPEDEQLFFKRILGGAMVCAIESNIEKARVQLELGREYLRKRTTERSRLWMLATTIPIVGVLAVIGLFFPSLFTMGEPEPSSSVWIIGLYFGMLGAFFSIVLRSGRRYLDSAAGFWLHFSEILARFGLGAVAGLVIVFVSISPLSPELFKDLALLAGGAQVLGFVAGFLDQLLPSIVSKYNPEIKS